jgi:hypothetical protein
MKDGNWQFDDNIPTVRSVGNWDAELGAHFTNGSFWWDPVNQHDDVYFDIRVGNADPLDDKYNQSYKEANSPPLTTGMEPCTEYFPLPINNTDETGEQTFYDDVLLKCHLAKLDIYLYPKQWSKGLGIYEFGIFILVNAPGYLPIQRDPCTGLPV